MRGAGPGPIPAASALSDRATDAVGADGVSSSVTQALLSLDAITDGASSPASSPSSSSRREEILDGASALFAERGYHGASLRDISKRVGISHPGMLHHFSSKQLLLGAVIDRLEAHAQGLLDAIPQLQRSPEALIAALGGPWDPRGHEMVLLATLSAEIVDPEHPGRYRIARLRLVHEHILEEVLQSFAERGLLIDGVDVKFLSRATVSLLLGLSVRENTVRAQQTAGLGDPVEDLQRIIQSAVTHLRAQMRMSTDTAAEPTPA